MIFLIWDITTELLNIKSSATIAISNRKKECILCGTEEATRIANKLNCYSYYNIVIFFTLKNILQTLLWIKAFDLPLKKLNQIILQHP